LSREPIIVVDNITKSFGDNHVLKGINLAIEEGKVTTIIGASGSGKSVLVKHIIGLLEPDSGRLIFQDEDLTAMGKRQRDKYRKYFGMLFQYSALFDSMNVEDNISFPLKEHTKLSRREIKKVVSEKLELLGLSGIERRSPSELSGGMRKRVALARAIVLNPKVIIYDEPTTGLDPVTTINVDRMIKEAQEKLQVTSVVISHDMASTFRISDNIAMLHKGKIIEHSKPEDFRTSERQEVQHFLAASSLGGKMATLDFGED
jgi:phospholipid/cholesterol/gamma-HCH transport system ATP-binding protein